MYLGIRDLAPITDDFQEGLTRLANVFRLLTEYDLLGWRSQKLIHA
jgi:hypothetical protein